MEQDTFSEELDDEGEFDTGEPDTDETEFQDDSTFDDGDDSADADADTDEDADEDVYEDEDEDEDAENQEVDLSAQHFPEITKQFEPVPHKFFTDPNYYKTAISGEGDISQRVHTILQKYLTTKDPKDRSVFRPQVISAYWEMLRNVAKKAPGKIIEPKKFLLRFGLLHPNFVKSETKDFFAKLVTENELNQPVYYLDEWLKSVGTGVIRASTTDEVKVAHNNTQVKLQQLLEKAEGKFEGFKALMRAKSAERRGLENTLHSRIDVITEHFTMDGFDDISAVYTDSQRRTFTEIQDLLKGLLKSDHELTSLVREYRQAEADVHTLRGKVEDGGEDETLDLQAVNAEFDTVRQAAKMTIGRQGNHYPILTSEYFHNGPNDVGYRENIINLLSRIESIDSEAFCRYYRNRLNRIAPYVLLLPTYGDTGICWEPFDKHNRATSRGRIIIPMYPRNLYVAVLSAVADLRWQVAKEKASYYRMEEGLTGNYYQWFAAQKIKGDVKEFFIQDYILWMTKEAEGIQKLDKEIRGTFWRYMPFSKEVKEKLRTRSYVYQELCQRDKNREMSDGY
jgi:hypothetical protein